jgi:hypothetical protein
VLERADAVVHEREPDRIPGDADLHGHARSAGVVDGVVQHLGERVRSRRAVVPRERTQARDAAPELVPDGVLLEPRERMVKARNSPHVPGGARGALDSHPAGGDLVTEASLGRLAADSGCKRELGRADLGAGIEQIVKHLLDFVMRHESS